MGKSSERKSQIGLLAEYLSLHLSNCLRGETCEDMDGGSDDSKIGVCSIDRSSIPRCRVLERRISLSLSSIRALDPTIDNTT